MDMLIKLYALGELFPVAPPGVLLRKPLGPEHAFVTQWVAQRFGALWSSEAGVALANRPVSLFMAQRQGQLLGFACWDATARGFVGPLGVAQIARGQGLGAALLRACLHDMRAAGYGYAVAGHVAAPRFFERAAGALEIPDSSPGLYAGLLR
ncbi:GNAT family N-acetyltransferase [Azohydromonas caseinilytica]|uniref:GNAT family N-acetyltransferase n=1 Tax=Azohydromonas caseinilytica TaxID=2728836 RepID=A0A848FB56_9BURK|nr:GNAT family N-acetyltransferase [Azohydromonas caseinilytica]NML16528.1 GNAT family N-acetyltransferase [Azohydromonas caseinilytica]